MKLLFVFSHWHGLVKLRLHTDHTIGILDDTTTELGNCLRDFVDVTCKEIPTKELRREYEARKWREAKKARQKGIAPTWAQKQRNSVDDPAVGRSSPIATSGKAAGKKRKGPNVLLKWPLRLKSL